LALAFPEEQGGGDGSGETPRTVIAARGLSVKRGGRVLFDGLDLEVRAGERILVEGPNGAGKTTLLRVLADETDPDAGSVAVRGEVGMLPQTHDTRILALDEPTNYLDFDALDVIEEALRAHRGTLVMVTHDRYFAERIGISRHWRFTGSRVVDDCVIGAV
jgi:ATPase subunit of ABC transporter with duplicated ATPase domains